MIPPWTLVLGYEHAIRKFANKLVSQEGYKFGEALKKAWKDATIKERHFISKGSKKGGKKGGAKGTKGQPHTWQSVLSAISPMCARYALGRTHGISAPRRAARLLIRKVRTPDLARPIRSWKLCYRPHQWQLRGP